MHLDIVLDQSKLKLLCVTLAASKAQIRSSSRHAGGCYRPAPWYSEPKTPQGLPQPWVAKSACWFPWWPFLFYAKFGIWCHMGRVFKIFKISAKIVRLKVKKIWNKNLVILIKILAEICASGVWIGYFFFTNRYMYGSTFKLPVALPY